MANCSNSASLSGRRASQSIWCGGDCYRHRVGRHFYATMPTASPPWTCSCVPTISFRLLYGLLILRHDRRRLLWLETTTHPTAEWISGQLTEACGWDEAPRYLIHDRDRSYGEVFVRRVRAMGIRDRPTFLQSPWQNGYAERLIGSIRRECIDHVIVFGECHLRHLLRSYFAYYNETRTHLSLDKDAPVSRAIQTIGRIFARPVLGGLHHQYVRI